MLGITAVAVRRRAGDDQPTTRLLTLALEGAFSDLRPLVLGDRGLDVLEEPPLWGLGSRHRHVLEDDAGRLDHLRQEQKVRELPGESVGSWTSTRSTARARMVSGGDGAPAARARRRSTRRRGIPRSPSSHAARPDPGARGPGPRGRTSRPVRRGPPRVEPDSDQRVAAGLEKEGEDMGPARLRRPPSAAGPSAPSRRPSWRRPRGLRGRAGLSSGRALSVLTRVSVQVAGARKPEPSFTTGRGRSRPIHAAPSREGMNRRRRESRAAHHSTTSSSVVWPAAAIAAPTQVLLRQRGIGAWRPCERLPRAAVVTGGASTGNHEVGVFVVSEEAALQVAEFLASGLVGEPRGDRGHRPLDPAPLGRSLVAAAPGWHPRLSISAGREGRESRHRTNEFGDFQRLPASTGLAPSGS